MAISFADTSVERSTNGSSWTAFANEGSGIRVSGGERQVAEFFVFALDYPILTKGKRAALQVEAAALYDEGVNSSYEAARAAYESGGDFFLRWSPQGGQSGEFMFTTDAGILTAPVYPQGEANSPDPITFVMMLTTPRIVKSVVA